MPLPISPPFTTFKLFINSVDYTNYVIPDSIQYANQLTRQGVATIQFDMKEMPGSYSVVGGARIDFYLSNTTYPLFSGQALQTEPFKHSVSGWTYRVTGTSWEHVFFRSHISIAFRNLTFEQAVNAVLQDSEQSFPTVISTTCLATAEAMQESMPFYSVSSVNPGDIFNLIAEHSSTEWRVVPGDTTDEFIVEFYDATLFTEDRPLFFTNSTKNFSWLNFKPLFDLKNIITSQTVRGAMTPSTSDEVALFRGDNLNSKFALPVKPYNNIFRVELYDNFDTTAINTDVWHETDIPENKVYQTGDGFIQFEPAGQWVGISSVAITERSNNPTIVADMTYLQAGSMMLGFTDQTSIPPTPLQFIEAGIFLDESGTLSVVANNTISSVTTLQLQTNTQYRFRITAKSEGGCKVEYQTGSDIYTRGWTFLGESSSGTQNDLNVVCYNLYADFNLASIKCTNPYLGIKLEVDRGQGYVEELIGVYPIDDDLDAVIEEQQTVSFFGSDPGPATIPPSPTAKVFTASDLVNNIMSVSGGHGISSGTAVKVSNSGGALPTGLTAGVTYYLRANSYTSFSLFDTQAHALAISGTTGIVDVTASGTGTHSVMPNAWVGLDSDYKNIRVTYKRGVILQATYRDHALIDILSTLFGNGDNGIREGQTIVDEKLTTYEACLARARLEVDTKSNLVRQIDMRTDWNTMLANDMPLPYVGDSANFEVNIDATNYTIEGTIPLLRMEVNAKKGGNNFEVRLLTGYPDRGIRAVLSALRASGALISINDDSLLYRNSFRADTVDVSDSSVATTTNTTSHFGDSRTTVNFTVNTSTDVLTTNSAKSLVTGHPVYVSTSGALPGGLSTDTIYYVGKITSTTYYVYDTQAHALANGIAGRVDFTSTGSGTHTITMAGFQWNYHRWGSFWKDRATIIINTDPLSVVVTPTPGESGGRLDFSDEAETGHLGYI